MDTINIEALKATINSKRDKYSPLSILIKDKHPDVYQYLSSIDGEFSEKLYLLLNGERPVCEYCGGPVKFKNFLDGFAKTCSKKCAAKNPNRSEKIKKTNMTKYGQSCSLHDTTNKAKTKRTLMKRYGVTNAFQIPAVQNKLAEKEYANWLKIFEELKLSPLFSLEQYRESEKTKPFEFKCLVCEEIFSAYICNGWRPKCPNCFKKTKQSSNFQQEIYSYLKQLFNYETSIRINDRQVLNPLELDFYLSEYSTAIECDGTYWHSDERKPKSYHVKKTEACLEKNIKLIHILESQWETKQKIIKARLKHSFQKTKYSIYGRKCEIRHIDNKKCSAFLDKYHIQGSDKSSVKYGAFYKNRLVAVMTFSKARFDKKAEWEMVRFCTIAHFNVLGIAGKLLKQFEVDKTPSSLVTYADRSWSEGSSYLKLGFKFSHNSSPNYWYYGVRSYNGLKLSRIQCQKHKLSKLLKKFDPTMSEYENMKANSFFRVWDCGNAVYKKTY
ncbi:MAG TPA: hypothetical protein PLA71_00640 [Saccharofermentans sp.]|mgnify:CR=1 FL=1|nr:hypothetical protein [Saccharofermentans sp.]